MNCAGFKEIAALYALGALDEAARAEGDAHLREPGHEGCFEELSAASAGTEALARSLAPVRPVPALWDRIAAALPAPATALPLRPRRPWGFALAAAAVLLVSLIGWSLAGERQRLQQAAALAAAERAQCVRELLSAKEEVEAQKVAIALLQSPGARLVTFASPGGKAEYAARALIDLSAHLGVVLSKSLAPREGRDYQLWVIRGKEPPRPAALLRASASGAVLLQIAPPLLAGEVDALAVSDEPKGGSPTGLPTGEVLLVGTLPKS